MLARAAHACASPRCGSSRSPIAPSSASSTRSSRSMGAPTSSCNPSWWPTRQLPSRAGDPRAAAAHRVAARVRGALSRDARGAAHPPDPAQRAAHGGGDGPRHHRHAARCASSTEIGARLGARRRHRRARAGAAAAHRQAGRVRLVARAHAAGAARSGRGRARGRARHAGWERPARRAARVPRRLLGDAATSSSTATPSCSRRCGSRCSTSSPRARAPRAGPSPPRG